LAADLRVGLNLAFLLPGEAGGRETHARELTLALAKARPDLELVCFVNREAAAADGFWGEVGRTVRLPLSPRFRPAWAWLETAGVPIAAARTQVDVLHSPANLGPAVGRFARVLTLHDVLFRSRPELLTPTMRLGTEALLPPAARRAHRVITVSRASREEIVRLLAIPAERVDVVPNGWTPPRTPGDAASARRWLEAGERPIALSVASDLPHKNLSALLEALALLEPPQRPLLAMAGHGTDTGALPGRSRELGVERDVRLLGAVAGAALEDLYAAAAVLVTATLLEGFGLPVLEALGRGVPAACTDLPVFREVAGDAALWLDPHNPGSVAAGLRRAVAGGPQIERLREQGRRRAREFEWRAAAERTAEIYERAAAQARCHG
jgi:glycosyltransferase involved in cell wall biosynthesis